MKIILNLLLAGMTAVCSAQSITALPIPTGAGTAEVWNDSLYFFGGSSTWGGRDQLYNRVYKFDGMAWSYQDSIPDNNVWDVESVLVGNEVYLLGGWRSGASMLRKYDLSDRTWTYLTPSPNTTTWGITTEYLNGFIYLFNNSGNVFEYDIAGNSWVRKTPNAIPAFLGLSSVVWQDEIYIVGFYDSDFYKYSPANDEWTQLADTPYPVAAGAMGIINNVIYCVGGSEQGNNSNTYRTILAYDIGANSWSVDQFQINGRRTWMAAAAYQGEFYVIGGFDSTGSAVDVMEKIVPLGPTTSVMATEPVPAAFSLSQNYPNPFNPATNIQFELPRAELVTLRIFDMRGREVATLVNEKMPAGAHSVNFDGRRLASGIYFYQLRAGEFVRKRKLALVK